MSKRNKLAGFGRKATAVCASVAIAGSFSAFSPAVIQAFADDDSSGAADASKYVSCSSYRAAEPAPEILGLSNVDSNTAWSGIGELTWSAPYYHFFGRSLYNSNPNPYMVNSVSNLNDGTNYSPSMVYSSSRTGGPTASMSAYNDDDETSAAVWDMLPDVILGNSSKVNYNSDDYAVAAANANNAGDYKTYGYSDIDDDGATESDYGVIYDSTNIYTMINSMYDLAAAGEEAADATGKTLRYDSDSSNALTIAGQFEDYVKGTQGYVLEQLEKNSKDKKKVALIYNYDSDSGTYQIIPTGVAEGTATANRYLEAVQNVATNIADDGRSTTTVGSGGNATTVATATADEIADCDLVMVGSQAGSENLADTDTIVDSLPTEVQNKTFWVNSDNGSAGSCYGVVMNSVENAQNIGRILGCLYPEYVDQSDWIAYYYQNFYHLNTDKLSSAVDNAMDGVRNYNNAGSGTDATSWSTSDVADYNESDVQAKIDEGVAYIATNKGSVTSTLVQSAEGVQAMIDELPTITADNVLDYASFIQDAESRYENLTDSDKSSVSNASTLTDAVSQLEDAMTYISNATVTLSQTSYTYNGKAKTPSVTVKIEGTTLTQGTDYTVSYSNNKKAGTAKVTITGKGTCTGTKTVTFKIKKASQKLKVSTAKKTVKAKKLKKKKVTTSKVKVKGAKGKVTYKKVSGSKKLKISKKTGKITVAKKTKKGTYKIKVKVKAASTTNYKSATKTATIKVRVK